ncbi:MAG: phosphonoacetaldehyde reductase [Candidatus Pacebacteria bacterium]|nr:phosphonoacetaldehyde reductase [Candidatus Paceibacterota bacterium]MDD5356541.1 phosphonoacetaldehyde reductase [Candidatus Paceibacterota bacterium]
MNDTKIQNVHSGEKGSLEFVEKFLDGREKNSSVFVVAGESSFKLSGAKAFFETIPNIPMTFFHDFSSNPKMEDVERGIEVFRSLPHSLIIGVGGGSAIDIAKSINFFVSHKIAPKKYSPEEKIPAQSCMPLMAVPTTAGTGSETTQFAVLYDGMIKKSVDHSSVLPSHVLLNAKFTESQSPYLTACAGMDAFAQGIESYWAVNATNESLRYSEECIRTCLKHLEKAVVNPNKTERKEMLNAAHLSGKAINIARTTAPHAFSYAMTAHYGLPHGHAVSLTLPTMFRMNGKITSQNIDTRLELYSFRQRMQNLYSFFGIHHEADDVAAFLEKLMDKIGLPRKWFTEKKYNLEEVRSTIIRETNQERLRNNPRKIEDSELAEIVKNIY